MRGWVAFTPAAVVMRDGRLTSVACREYKRLFQSAQYKGCACGSAHQRIGLQEVIEMISEVKIFLHSV